MADTQTLGLPLVMRAQYIKDLSFENPNPIEAFTENLDEQPDISVNIGVRASHLGQKNFEVEMHIRVEAKRSEKTLFITELVYACIAGVDGDITEEQASPMIMIDAPSLMFPFARNILSDITRDGGFPPFFLSPVDFAALYKKQKEEQDSKK